MTRRTDLEALGQFVYGKDWRTAVVNETQWDILIEFAAAKQLREVLKQLKLVVHKQGDFPGTITLSLSGNDSKVESIHRRSWSEQTDREVKTRCAGRLKEIFEGQGVKVEIRDGDEGTA